MRFRIANIDGLGANLRVVEEKRREPHVWGP